MTGKAAPRFTLEDQDGRRVSLEDFRSRWVVLYFYPRDDTPGCTVEACEFTDSLKDFQSLDAAVLGVSPDNPASHRKFIDKHRLRITLLFDPDHQVLGKYGAWGEKMMYGRSVQGVIRSTVLISPQGRVAHHWPRVKAKGHAEEVRKKIEELRRSTCVE